jgi:hypothetical protein
VQVRETDDLVLDAPSERLVDRGPCGGSGFRRDNAFTRQHHYFQERVAKLFSGSSGTDVPTEQEQMFRALNQTLNSLITLRRVDRLVPDLPDRSHVRAVLTYPAIVCNEAGRLFCVDMENDDPPQPAPDRFLFEINYAWLNSANHNITEYGFRAHAAARGTLGRID